jgi:nitrate/TMAO reductase-like tetraheme cytochrome c subunit
MTQKKKKWFAFLLTKRGIFLILAPIALIGLLSSHELAVRYFPEFSCVVCHEMKDPVRRWYESGVAKNHPNCADCHFDTGLARLWKMNRAAVVFFVEHFKREAQEPIKPPQEPLFLDLDKEPGYYSLVPNHRCYQCKDAKNHKQIEQQMVHRKLIKDVASQPCKDCHNHEMRNGQKFYEQILPGQEKAPAASQ